ncbi:MAG: serine/threonine protein kinase [Holophagales bacterium]|nr:serine/threonine protein kinase [Holophagales bacterium]
MTPLRWQRVLEIAREAFDLDAGDRGELLDQRCAGDPLLRRKVEAILRADELAEDFLATSPRIDGLGPDVFGRQPEPGFTRSAADALEARQGRFVPGAVLGNRYRVVSVVGRGGMGEVVRADDLKLGEPVALKFLPALLADDPPALAQLRHEVRLARRVSHPNICRVHDIGEAEGLHFLSMEYVDGEDLASLLRRIGRLPSNKGIELAQQLCAGLGAAHEQGILHRDLKPANVMIDGRGRVRITDFGVATLQEQASSGRGLSGTPAYMAPELLSDPTPTVASDVWALGLVLFEIFTGRRAFHAGSPAELVADDKPPERPSALVRGLDGDIERILLSCLEKEPAQRPASASEVAAALPGGDPLAAAVAAGKTPSPEMVAASPDRAGLRPGVAAAMLAFVLLGFGAQEMVRERIDTPGTVVAGKSPAVLLDRARDLVGDLGYGESPVGELAYGLSYDPQHRAFWSDPSGPRNWQEEVGAPVYFWYRQRPRPPTLDPFGDWGRQEGPLGPAVGTVRLRLDLDGHLRRLEAVPPHRAAGRSGSPALGPLPRDNPWGDLFVSAGLDPGLFEPVAPSWPPPVYAHRRAAWRTFDGQLAVEAAASEGKAVYFEIFALRSAVDETPESRGAPFELAQNLTMAIFLGLLVAGGWIASRNLRLDRSDRQGAGRLTALVFGLEVLGWMLRFEPGLAVHPWGQRLIETLGRALFIAATVGVYYLAFEPSVRRLWPQALVSWSRLIGGRLRDPRIGRDLLIGGVFGVCMIWSGGLGFLLSDWLGQGERVLATANLDALLGTPQVLAQLLLLVRKALYMTFLHMLFLLLLRLVIRRVELLAVAFVAIETVLIYSWFAYFFQAPEPSDWLFAFLMACCMAALVMRFGLVATFSATLIFFEPSMFPVVTTRLSSWSAAGTVLVALAIGGLMVFAFLSVAGRPWFRDPALGPRAR